MPFWNCAFSVAVIGRADSGRVLTDELLDGGRQLGRDAGNVTTALAARDGEGSYIRRGRYVEVAHTPGERAGQRSATLT